MHRIRFRLGLRSRHRWGSSQRSPRSPSCISGVLLLRKKGKKKTGEKEKERKKQEGRKGEEKRGKETRSPIHVSGYATENKGGGRATKMERTKNTKKINGRKGKGKASELGSRLPPGAEGGWTPLIVQRELFVLQNFGGSISDRITSGGFCPTVVANGVFTRSSIHPAGWKFYDN